MAKKNGGKNKPQRVRIKNKRATFDYEVIDKFMAGIVLTGTEIKSIRDGKASLVDTFCFIHDGEIWVKNMYIAEYACGTYNNHATRRDRKPCSTRKKSVRCKTIRSHPDTPSFRSCCSSTTTDVPNSTSPSAAVRKNTTSAPAFAIAMISANSIASSNDSETEDWLYNRPFSSLRAGDYHFMYNV